MQYARQQIKTLGVVMMMTCFRLSLIRIRLSVSGFGIMMFLLVLGTLSGCNTTAKPNEQDHLSTSLDLNPVIVLNLPNGHRAVLAKNEAVHADSSINLLVILDEDDHVLAQVPNVFWDPDREYGQGGIALAKLARSDGMPDILFATQRFAKGGMIPEFPLIISISLAVWFERIPGPEPGWSIVDNLFEFNLFDDLDGRFGVFWIRLPPPQNGKYPRHLELMFTPDLERGETRESVPPRHYATMYFPESASSIVEAGQLHVEYH
ncbi:MAG: hypothetical protein JJU36_04745 [Phycisphaeraceae bacterium]|nr:hypothetical protein [Phycisphaeraceae bacterium]